MLHCCLLFASCHPLLASCIVLLSGEWGSFVDLEPTTFWSEAQIVEMRSVDVWKQGQNDHGSLCLTLKHCLPGLTYVPSCCSRVTLAFTGVGLLVALTTMVGFLPSGRWVMLRVFSHEGEHVRGCTRSHKYLTGTVLYHRNECLLHAWWILNIHTFVCVHRCNSNHTPV